MSLYKDRVAAGLCGMCGAEKPGGTLCAECKEKSRARTAARREKNRKQGGCIGCGAAVESGTRCEACKESQKTSRKKSVEKRKESGQCVACPNIAKEDCVLCQECIDKRSEVSSTHYRRRKDAGLCRFCGRGPAEPGGSMCAYHKEKYKDYRMQVKLDAMEAYGGPQCSLCPCDDVEILEIDHIDGGGNEHRREIGKGHLGAGSGYNFYLWLRQNAYPKGFRVLCPSCNKKAYCNSKK